MRNVLSEKLYVKCSCDTSNKLEVIGECVEYTERSWVDKIKNCDSLKTNELEKVFDYEREFKTIADRVQKTLSLFQCHKNLLVFWDGITKILRDVHAVYEQRTFYIHYAIDYTSFFIKWVIATSHFRLV